MNKLRELVLDRVSGYVTQSVFAKICDKELPKLLDERDQYWRVVKYFQQEGNQSERDIVANLLKNG